MSELSLLHTERRWQRFVLVPLNILFIASAILFFLKGAWWVGAAFVLLVLYIGHVGARLQIHQGRTFGQLSQGITPSLPPAPELPEQEDLSDEEIRILVATMIRTKAAIAVAAIVLCLGAGARWYWALLVGVAVYWIGHPIGSMAIALLSSPKAIRRRFRGDKAR